MKAELDVTLANPEPTLEEYAAMAGAIRQAGDRSERLIDSLLTLARSEGGLGTERVVDLGALARSVVTVFEPTAERRSIRLEASVEDGLVRGDEVLLQRLIENLVENAIRYNETGGWVAISSGTAEGVVRLTVRNGGEPIPVGDVDGLFEPFRRRGLDRVDSARGIGLGLAIVRAVAKAHGGAATATAPTGGGLEVSVELPAVSVRQAEGLYVG
jgi:signal transduction histidine kinase